MATTRIMPLQSFCWQSALNKQSGGENHREDFSLCGPSVLTPALLANHSANIPVELQNETILH